MQIIPGNAQHIGSRKEQQDDFGFSDLDNVTFVNHGGVLAVIADGMGGLARGREASLIAKQAMLQEYDRKSEKKTIPQALIRALSVANAAVVEMARLSGLEGQIGTTLTAAAIKDDELYWVSVGDSRIYLYRRGEIIQLTTDHDYARELAREAALGNISPEEAATHPQRQALTSYLGLPFLHEIDRNEDPVILEAGDRILLCSDGLYKTLAGEEILKLVDGEAQHAADSLIEATLARGKTSQDNVTVAILACEPDLEIGFFYYWFGMINLYGKALIIILIVLFGVGSAAYVTKRYFSSPKTNAKGEVAPVFLDTVLKDSSVIQEGRSVIQEGRKTGKDRNGDKLKSEVSPGGAEEGSKPTGVHPGQGGVGPSAQGQRWTAPRKLEVVLRLFRGEPVELLSRELGVELDWMEKWRDAALAGMEEALKTRSGDPLQGELDQAKKRLKKLTEENKLLREQVRRLGPSTKGREKK